MIRIDRYVPPKTVIMDESGYAINVPVHQQGDMGWWERHPDVYQRILKKREELRVVGVEDVLLTIPGGFVKDTTDVDEKIARLEKLVYGEDEPEQGADSASRPRDSVFRRNHERRHR